MESALLDWARTASTSATRAVCFRARWAKPFTRYFSSWRSYSPRSRWMLPVAALARLTPRIAAEVRAIGVDPQQASRIAAQALEIALKAAGDPHSAMDSCAARRGRERGPLDRSCRRQPAHGAGGSRLPRRACAKSGRSRSKTPGGSSITRLRTRTASILPLRFPNCAASLRRRSRPTQRFCATCMAQTRPCAAASIIRACRCWIGGSL